MSDPHDPNDPSEPSGYRRDKGRAPARDRVERVYGLSATLAVFARRPNEVVSIAHTQDVRHALADVLRDAARRHIAYREVDAAELARMADSVHHEGVCMLVRPLPSPGPEAISRSAAQQGLVLALDGVQNPHNVGAMLRSAAYFGLAAVVLADQDRPLLTPAARRIAEGGAELVPIAHVPGLPAALQALAAQQFVILGADAHAKQSLSELSWPKRTVLVLGHEQHGLSAETRKLCTTLVRIAGGDALDSLNVSVAAGIFMASFASAHGPAA